MHPLFEKVKSIDGIKLKLQVDVGSYTTMKLTAIGDIVEVDDSKNLELLISILKEHQYKYHLIGLGANQVILNTKDTLFIRLKFENSGVLKLYQDKYELLAGVTLNKLTSAAIKHGLSGWECLTGIPATVGGAIFMNAGTKFGEICSFVESVKILRKSGKLENYKVNEESFSYRKNNFVSKGDIIVSAILTHNGKSESVKETIKEYLEYRNNTQPLGTQNCGCVFKNNERLKAGASIDKAGLKGFGFNGIKVSQKHGNFFENTDGSAKDFVRLVETVNEKLFEQFDEKFELEVKIY
ncbi:MAG: FAD-binding protein [Bacteriovoracaceae bacterium]|jgi:UDP-N-acetylmuramate dehydrogenase|nr:FAD-binding protein [Bacteriovoracaceae bacterium]